MPRFSEVLREHARYPSNQGAIENPDLVGTASLNGNPPFITIYLVLENDTVTNARFTAAGCGVSTAICSVTTETLMGKTIRECAELSVQQVCDSLEGVPGDKLHCVHVVLRALSNALESASI